MISLFYDVGRISLRNRSHFSNFSDKFVYGCNNKMPTIILIHYINCRRHNTIYLRDIIIITLLLYGNGRCSVHMNHIPIYRVHNENIQIHEYNIHRAYRCWIKIIITYSFFPSMRARNIRVFGRLERTRIYFPPVPDRTGSSRLKCNSTRCFRILLLLCVRSFFDLSTPRGMSLCVCIWLIIGTTFWLLSFDFILLLCLRTHLT